MRQVLPDQKSLLPLYRLLSDSAYYSNIFRELALDLYSEAHRTLNLCGESRQSIAVRPGYVEDFSSIFNLISLSCFTAQFFFPSNCLIWLATLQAHHAATSDMSYFILALQFLRIASIIAFTTLTNYATVSPKSTEPTAALNQGNFLHCVTVAVNRSDLLLSLLASSPVRATLLPVRNWNDRTITVTVSTDLERNCSNGVRNASDL